MPGSTTGLALPYPILSDVPNIVSVQTLAQRVQDTLGADSGFQSITVASGFGGAVTYRKYGPFVWLVVLANKSGANIASATGGLVTIPSGVAPSSSFAFSLVIGDGPNVCRAYFDSATRTVNYQNLTINTGQTLHGSVAWITAI